MRRLYSQLPQESRHQVVKFAGVGGVTSIGYLSDRTGPAVDAFGTRPAFLGLAVALLLVALGTTLLSPLRLLGDLPDTPPGQEVSRL